MANVSPLSLSPTHTLLWAYQLDGKGAGHEMSLQSFQLDQQADTLIWIHLQCDADNAETWLASLGVDSAIIDALTMTETRPRAMPLKGGMLVLLRGINKTPDADPDDMISLRIWFKDNCVITARKRERRLLSVHDMKDSLDRGLGPSHSGEFVVKLVERLANRVSETVDDIDEELTFFETECTQMSHSDMRSRLAVVRRQAAAIRRYLAPQRDALDVLYRERGVLTEQDAFVLREQTDRTTRYVEELDLARERSIVLQDELRNQIAEQQNMRMYVLSIITAIFLPLSFLTGVFGMNVAGLPGTETPSAFYDLTFAMLGVAGLALGLMKWQKWL